MRRAMLHALLALAALLLFAPSARAQCTVSVRGIEFGSYLYESLLDAEGWVEITCSSRQYVEVELSAGLGGTFFPRKLRLAGQEQYALPYNIYFSNHTSIWGDWTPGTSAQVMTIRKRQTTRLTLYGRIPAGQDVPAGQYRDRITVLVNY